MRENTSILQYVYSSDDKIIKHGGAKNDKERERILGVIRSSRQRWLVAGCDTPEAKGCK